MARTVYELQGYAVVMDKVAFITRVFEAGGNEGYQFNIRFTGETRLSPKFSTRHDADLERKLFIEALKKSC